MNRPENPDSAEWLDAHPFLRELPPAVREHIDPSEILVPGKPLARLRSELQSELGVYVMTYRPGAGAVLPRSGRLHLCSILAAATLDARALARLRRAEAHHPEARLVAYARPLQMRLR